MRIDDILRRARRPLRRRLGTVLVLPIILLLAAAAVLILPVRQLLPADMAGTATLPAGYVGRSAHVAPQWRTTFQDDFLQLSAAGKFLQDYSAWTAYPDNFLTTAGQRSGVNRGDHYSVDTMSVVDAGTARVLNCRLVTRSETSDGTNWGAAPSPVFDVGVGNHRARSMKVEMRVRIPDPAPGWHIANLLWFDDKTWPTGGEINFWEQPATGSIGAFFHFDQGTTGGDKRQFSTSASPTQWHVIGFEWIGGTSYRQFLDGVQVGSTITTRVPSTPGRLVLQNEPSGESTSSMDVQYDWITVWTA